MRHQILLVLAFVALIALASAGNNNNQRPPMGSPLPMYNVKQCVIGSANFSMVIPGVGVVGGLELPNDYFGPALYAAQPNKKRYVFENGSSSQYTFANGTYAVSLNAETGGFDCYYDSYATYNHESLARTNVIKIEEIKKEDRYFGLTYDVGSCFQQLAFEVLVNTKNGRVSQFTFSQGFPTPIGSPPSNINVVGIFDYDDKCSTNGDDFEARFQLPAICLVPDLPAWCDTFKFN